MALSTSSNFAKPDDAFRAVVEAHRGLSDEQSADLDAALVLILANHIGDLDVLREAIALAQAADGRMRASSNSNSNSSSRICLNSRHCERSEAIQLLRSKEAGLLRRKRSSQ